MARSPREVVREYLRALERADLAALDDLVDEKLTVYKPSGDVAFTELQAWKAAVADDPFGDERIEIEELVCEGDKVAVRYRVSCIQTRPAFGVAPSAERITTSGTKIYRVRAGKIVEIAGHDDLLGVLRQLGVVAPDL